MYVLVVAKTEKEPNRPTRFSATAKLVIIVFQLARQPSSILNVVRGCVVVLGEILKKL
jgi:hypothetical protein